MTTKQYVVVAVTTMALGAVVLALLPLPGLIRAVARVAVTLFLMWLLLSAVAAAVHRGSRD